MKILISPAKSITFAEASIQVKTTVPIFEKETTLLVNKLKKMSVKKLIKLMDISSDLATLNTDRYANFEFPSEVKSNNHPAIFSFSGEVYRGFDALTLTQAQEQKVQDQLLILSGLYGFLKPFDLFHPYRLEMGTALEVNAKHKNLYSFWKTKLTAQLKNELNDEELLVNLASIEYSKAIDFSKLNNKTVVPQFKEFKNGSYKTIAIFAKNARGKMARFLIENDAKTEDDIRLFDWDNYTFDATLSKGNEMIFVR